MVRTSRLTVRCDRSIHFPSFQLIINIHYYHLRLFFDFIILGWLCGELYDHHYIDLQSIVKYFICLLNSAFAYWDIANYVLEKFSQPIFGTFLWMIRNYQHVPNFWLESIQLIGKLFRCFSNRQFLSSNQHHEKIEISHIKCQKWAMKFEIYLMCTHSNIYMSIWWPSIIDIIITVLKCSSIYIVQKI